MKESRPKLLVFSDDWGRHPSSCQHLIRYLAEDVEVCWVNTIGTRRPTFSAYTIWRGLGKIGRWLLPEKGAPLAANPDRWSPLVLDPIMWPSFRSRASRLLNRTLLERAIDKAYFVDRRTVVVTTLPLVADLQNRLGARRWVYYCVDDLSTWPGLDGSALASMEKQLVASADRLVVVSEHLAHRMREAGRDAELLSHGLDLEFWRRTPTARPEIGPLGGGPFIVFWGVVDRRLDLGFIDALSHRLTSGTILFVGPQNDPDPKLSAFENVRLTGPIPFEQLPGLGALADVLIMPYADLPVTRALQPLKFKEYLATGKPVVVSNLPAVRSWQDACDVVSSPDEFADAIRTRLETGTPESQLAARQRLEDETWAAKAVIFKSLLFD